MTARTRHLSTTRQQSRMPSSIKRREDPVDLTRRDLGKLALAAIPASRLIAKPNSNFDGVRVGVITYSYRSMPGANDAEALLKYIVDSGISGIELMAPAAEIYAGSPVPAGRGGYAGRESCDPGTLQ